MRYTLIVEDTAQGIAVGYVESRNGVQDHPANSLAAHTVASFAMTLDKLSQVRALHIVQQTLTPSKA